MATSSPTIDESLAFQTSLFCDESSRITATSAPRDKAGKTLELKDWTLKNYIDVAHELKWITTTAKDIGEVMRDYRNYIDPQKELSHGITLVECDAQMLWEIAKKMILQIL